MRRRVSFGTMMTTILLQTYSMKQKIKLINKDIHNRINTLMVQYSVSAHHKGQITTAHQHQQMKFIQIIKNMSQKVVMK